MILRKNWQREELLLALNLYCRLPFGQYHHRTPEIVELAKFIQRTPDAVAMKLSNFASFDPHHQARGIKGLQNASKADRAIWDEWQTNWHQLAVESALAYLHVNPNEIAPASEDQLVTTFIGATEAERTVKVRLAQRFFRTMILTSYQQHCCVCGMPISELLVASHIIRWSDDATLRTNPHNGLCLCTLHDKGFDRGLFSIDANYKIRLGKTLRNHQAHPALQNTFAIYHGQSITLPDKFLPEPSYLAFHQEHYFLG